MFREVEFPLIYIILFINTKCYVWIEYLFVSHSMIKIKMPKPCMTIIEVTIFTINGSCYYEIISNQYDMFLVPKKHSTYIIQIINILQLK